MIHTLRATGSAELLTVLAAHAGAETGEYAVRVPHGAHAGNGTFQGLRYAAGDPWAMIVAIPSLGRPTHWAAVAEDGRHAAIVAVADVKGVAP